LQTIVVVVVDFISSKSNSNFEYGNFFYEKYSLGEKKIEIFFSKKFITKKKNHL